MNCNIRKSNQEKINDQEESHRSIHHKDSWTSIKGSSADEEIKAAKLKNKEFAEKNWTKPQLHLANTRDGNGTNSYSKMIETQKATHSIEPTGTEPEFRSRSKVIFNLPDTTSKDQKGRSSSKQEGTDDISSVISHVVDRVCESSVSSDVSGLTDGECFKTDDFSTPSVTASSNNKNFKSEVRAPEPPSASPANSKLTDIQSDTTATTSSCSRDEKSPKNRKKRSVSFCEVQVRKYERILEVNPSVTSGPAVGIGWNYSAEDEIFSLEIFEETREYSRRTSVKELALPRAQRETLLRIWGYTEREIAWSVRTILRSKNQRKQTIHNLHASSMEEFMEKATRKMKHVLLLPLHSRKRSQKRFLYPPQTYTAPKNSSLVQPIAV